MRVSWSVEETQIAIEMHRIGLTYADVAQALLGRTPQEISLKLRRLREQAAGTYRKNAIANQILRDRDDFAPPAHVLADRDRRSNLPLTLNMFFLGDPAEPRWHFNRVLCSRGQ